MSGIQPRSSAQPEAAAIEIRPLRFEDVAATLRMIRRAVEHGCRDHYNPFQREAVFRTYAVGLFVESIGPFDSVVAFGAIDPTSSSPTPSSRNRLLGFAQLDPGASRLRGLFVDADAQGRGVGAKLLAEIERRAVASGVKRLHGAMSLNAVPFYAGAGFRSLGGTVPLTTSGVDVPVVRMEKPLQ
jgi:GNAT superfamily N-acetyltransferase